jgi:2-polyprenyl-3-methyl-5-hydroxy-6-metoxy-1,4-benzoquinol methylase
VSTESVDTIGKALQDLVRIVDPHNGNPNVSPLRLLVRDIGIMRLNQKNYGYEVARALGGTAMAAAPVEPPCIELGWRPSTQVDIESDWSAYWCNELGTRPVYHRKMWELAYVLHNLWYHGAIQPGKRGIGFGCGQEPIPSYLASKGVEVVATDLAPDHVGAKAWRETNQHTADLEKIWQAHLVERQAFDDLVSLRYVDMNEIPKDMANFDFCWSVCAFEHLGSLKKGMNFIENSLSVLKPGGISVHTTEFNFMDSPPIDNWPTVLFQRQNFEVLANALRSEGHKVDPISFDIGQGCLDRFIDLPPYAQDELPESMRDNGAFPAHIKLSVEGIASTCFGLVVRKAG